MKLNYTKNLINKVLILTENDEYYNKIADALMLPKGLRKDLLKLINSLEGEYLILIRAYYSKNKVLAYAVAGKKTAHTKACDKLMETYNEKKVGRLVEKLRSIVSSIHNISKAISY